MERRPGWGESIVGWRFGRLFVEAEGRRKGYMRYYSVRCDCGTVKEVLRSNLTGGSTTSCGCLRVEASSTRATTHGKTGTRVYRIYKSMMTRCYNEAYHEYHLYGGAGITVCESWRKSFANFLADMGEPPATLQLDRVDGSKGYSKDNCRWVTPLENNRNRVSTLWVEHEGVKLTLKELSDKLGIDYHAMYDRYARGYRGAALALPSRGGDKHLKALQPVAIPTPVRTAIKKVKV